MEYSSNILNAAQGKFRLGPSNIICLIWTVDIVGLPGSEEGSREMLKLMEKFCDDNRLIVNTDKIKCMTFNKTRRFIRNKFSLNNLQLEVVRFM